MIHGVAMHYSLLFFENVVVNTVLYSLAKVCSLSVDSSGPTPHYGTRTLGYRSLKTPIKSRQLAHKLSSTTKCSCIAALLCCVGKFFPSEENGLFWLLAPAVAVVHVPTSLMTTETTHQHG